MKRPRSGYESLFSTADVNNTWIRDQIIYAQRQYLMQNLNFSQYDGESPTYTQNSTNPYISIVMDNITTDFRPGNYGTFYDDMKLYFMFVNASNYPTVTFGEKVRGKLRGGL
jgi:hypothetical protein